MTRHGGTEGFKLEGQIGMTSGNHNVVHFFFRSTEMAGEATFGAFGQVPGVIHAQLQGLLVSPILYGVRPEPAHCRAMATLATDTVFQVLKGLRTLFGLGVQGVTGQTFFRLVGGLLKAKNFPHANRCGIGEHRVGTGVFVLSEPDAVFVLRDANDSLWLNPPVAVAGSAGTWTGELAHLASGFGRLGPRLRWLLNWLLRLKSASHLDLRYRHGEEDQRRKKEPGHPRCFRSHCDHPPDRCARRSHLELVPGSEVP